MAYGETVYTGGDVSIGQGETIKGPVFFSGNSISIDGTIDGALFAAGKQIIINGKVTGDVFTASQDVTIGGDIEGNLFSAAQNIFIDGKTSQDAFLASQNLRIERNAVIGRDILAAAENLLHQGTINRQLWAAAKDSSISGTVYDDAKLETERLMLNNGAAIKGKLIYKSPIEAQIQPDVELGGKEWQKTSPKKNINEQPSRKTFAEGLFSSLVSILGAVIVWYLLVLMKPSFWQDLIRPIALRPFETFGLGLLALFLLPPLALVLLLTVIGIPVAILLLMLFGIMIYLAKIIFAVYIGNALAERFSLTSTHKGLWLTLAGLAIIALISAIPVVGFMFNFFIICVGLGTVTQVLRRPPHLY